MSVTAQSPYCGTKRLFDRSESAELGSISPSKASGKRSRFVGSPLSRCSPVTDHQAYAVGATTIAALKALFPTMEEQTIANVLEECGSNIDLAIKRLGELKLSSRTDDEEHTIDNVNSNGSAGEPSTSGAARPGESTLPTTAEEWVEVVVQQMSQAKDIADAKQRAVQILAAFEKRISQLAGNKVGGASNNALVAENQALHAQIQELLKDNSILKRAIGIYNHRLQELAGKEAELQQTKHLLAQYQEKLHNLEVSNYSLALHLKQATDAQDSLRGQRNPDVF